MSFSKTSFPMNIQNLREKMFFSATERGCFRSFPLTPSLLLAKYHYALSKVSNTKPPPSFWQSITMLFQKFQTLQKSAKNFLDWNPSPSFCHLFQKGMVKTPTICYLIFFGLDKRLQMLKKSFIWYAMFVH